MPGPPSFLPPEKKRGKKGRGKTLLVIGVIVVVVLAAGGGGYWLWSSGTFASMLAASDDSGTVTSKNSQDAKESAGDDASEQDEPSDEAKPSQDSESSADESPSVAVSAPTAVVAWATQDGQYRVKWGEPKDDGGEDITGYVVSECDGGELDEVGGDTLFTTIKDDNLDCVSVHAVTESGPGEAATAEVKNN